MGRHPNWFSTTTMTPTRMAIPSTTTLKTATLSGTLHPGAGVEAKVGNGAAMDMVGGMLNGIMLDGVVKASCFPSWIFASWMLLNRVDGPPLMEYNGQLAGSENHLLMSRWMVAASCR